MTRFCLSAFVLTLAVLCSGEGASAQVPKGKKRPRGPQPDSAKHWHARFFTEVLAAEAVLYSPDGRHIACALAGAHIEDTSTGKQVYNPASTTIVDVSSGNKVHRFTGDPIGFAPDGQTLLTGSDAGLTAWDYLNGKQVRSLGKWPQARGRIRFLTNPVRLVVQDDTRLVILDYATGRVLHRIAIPAKGNHPDSNFAVTPDGGTVAQLVVTKPNPDRGAPGGHHGAGAGVPNIPAAEQGVVLLDLKEQRWTDPIAVMDSRDNCLAVSPDGRTLAVGQSSVGETPQTGRVTLWDISVRPPKQLSDAKAWGNAPCRKLIFSPDGKSLLADRSGVDKTGAGGRYSGKTFGRVELREVTTGRLVQTGEFPQGYRSGLGFTPDGKVAFAVDREGSDIMSWDSGLKEDFLRETNEWFWYARRELDEVGGALRIAIRPDGKQIIFTNGKSVPIVLECGPAPAKVLGK